MSDNVKVEMAVLKTEFNGLREQHKAHAEVMENKFDSLAEKIEPVAEWIQKNHGIPEKVHTLWDSHNSQKGFFKASQIAAGILGAAFLKVGEWIWR